ncbi:MAG TPA: hypothetical protein DCZ91_11805 [Lachnospiraceae bacterium]|nr:hypothetical protein [Lachnospiraceae bacterium]
MKWLKKWCYFILLTGCGIVYLSCVDHWQVYAEPWQRVRSWYDGLVNGDLFAGGQTDETWVSVDGGVSPDSDSDGSGENTGSGNGVVNAPGVLAENGSDGSLGEGNTENYPENMTGSGNAGSYPEGTTGSGNAGSYPEGTTGSGNTGSYPGGMSGSGNTGSYPGGITGSGNAANHPGGITGSGNAANRPGGITGSGNTGNYPGGITGSGNTGTAPGGPGGNFGENTLPEVQYMTVEDDYFADAVFIGDSRTVGMFEYGGLEEISTFYASKGLTVYKLFDADIVPVPDERKQITVEEALQQNSFAKIYLMIGINEMGTGTVESFLEKYQEVVAHLRELQPDAVIYLQAIIKVTAERSGKGDYINNEGIIARNEGIAKLADNEKIFFLDVNPEVCDESGGMIPDYTFDGVHLKARYIEIWKDYLKTHAISS